MDFAIRRLNTPKNANIPASKKAPHVNYFGFTSMVPFLFGGAFGLKSEPRHRGMNLGISPYVPDNWGRQLAAGGDKWTRTTDPLHVKQVL